MPRSIRATHNQVFLTAYTAETAINTAQTLDLQILASLEDVINKTYRRESNENEMNGLEEADTIYNLGGQSEGTLNFNKMQPQHAAMFAAYGLGLISSSAVGDGYKHVITPISDDIDANRSLESMTVAMRYGKTILKRRFTSMFVNSLSMAFNLDSWVQLTVNLMGTGKTSKNITRATITAADDATSLTLTGYTVHGSSAQDRLDNVQAIRVYDADSSGAWEEVQYTAVAADSDPAITIVAPGTSEANVTYEVLFRGAESGTWADFSSLSRVEETPLRVSGSYFYVGGAWDGSSFTPTYGICEQVRGCTWNLNNNLEMEFGPCAGEDNAYASRVFRPAREQTITLNREFRDYILQNYIDQNETFGFRILAEGGAIDATYNFQVEIIFPKVGIIDAPISVDGKRLAEVGDLKVLEDSTYGSVIVNVQNEQATYMA